MYTGRENKLLIKDIALNDFIFPLGTDTYPHTRGMKVEIVAIFIVFCFGIMSQMKLWRIVKEKREAKEAVQRKLDADLNAIDEESGRRIEKQAQAERAQWEAEFGNQENGSKTEMSSSTEDGRPDSGLGASQGAGRGTPSSESPAEKDLKEGEIVMAPVEESTCDDTNGQQPRDITIQVGIDDQPASGPLSPVSNNGHLSAPEESPAVSRRNSYVVDPRRQSAQSLKLLARHSLQSICSVDVMQTVCEKDPLGSEPEPPRSMSPLLQTPPPPTPSPTPSPPTPSPPPPVIPLPLPIPQEEEEGEADMDDRSSVATRAFSERFSISTNIPAVPEFTGINRPISSESASSLAATCADRIELEDFLPMTRSNTQELLAFESDTPSPTDMDEQTKANTTVGLTTEDSGLSFEVEKNPMPEESNSSHRASQERLSEAKGNVDTELAPPPSSKTGSGEVQPAVVLPQDLVPASHPKSQSTSSVSRGSGFEVQTQCSKVVKTFRTNEWAKHLAEAEKPELDSLAEPHRGVDAGYDEEIPARLDIQDLQETANSRPNSRLEKQPKPINAVKSHVRTGSRSKINLLVENLSYEQQQQVEERPLSRNVDRISKENTLLGVRENLVRNRASFNTLEKYDRMPNDQYRSPSAMGFNNMGMHNTISRHSPSPTLGLSDDMPLADRQHLLYQSISQQSLQNPRTPPQGRISPFQQPQLDRRAEILSDWRQSVRAEKQTQNMASLADQRRAEMLEEKNQAAMRERRKEMKGNFMGGVIEERMRQKDMLELHREAMRKMQAGANRHAS
jgi:hypothetical protein